MLVQDVIQGCSTGQIQGLSQQILDRLVVRGSLAKIDHPLIACEGSHNNPYLQPLALRALIKAVEKVGQRLHINSCLRTIPQQYMLRKQYEKKLCGITAAAKPGKSNHQSGAAIDIRDYLFWREPLISQGWQWLGLWDKWHFDYKFAKENLSFLQVQTFQELWNEFNPDRPLKVDGLYGNKTAKAIANSPVQGFNKKYPTYKKGDMNFDVGQIQFLLRSALGLSNDQLIADCQFGAQTFKAVLTFQRKYRLSPTGEANEQTIKKLLEVTGRESLYSNQSK